MAYTRSVTTFVDILGFDELVHRAPASDVVEKLDAIANTVAKPVGPDGSNTTTLMFSDSVIRARALGSETIYGALLHEIMDLATSQWTLLEFGVPIRGGTTVGDVSMGEGRAFGPAFVRAYRLESALASSPRIVIDPFVVESIRAELRASAHSGGKDQLIAGLRDHIRQGDDGVWFVDYINSVWITMGDPAHVGDTLAKMRDFIIDEARRFADNPLVLPKYLWMVRYHNASAKRLLPHRRELKITAADVPASDEFLKQRRRG